MEGFAESHQFLSPIQGPEAWTGSDMALLPSQWCHHWSSEEIDEILNAIELVSRRGLDLLEITRADFPLPTVSARISYMRRYLLEGPGFYLFRGFSLDDLSLREAALAFWGIGLYLGRPCSQNGKGHLLGHVKNLGLNYDDPLARGYQTSARLPYHTDSSDLVGLLCWRPAKSGGMSSIVSSTTVYNEVIKRSPEAMKVLLRPFYRTRWGEIPEGKEPWAEVPIFMPHAGRVISHYVRSAIRKGQLLPGAPPLTDEQTKALDLIDEIANEEGINLKMIFQPGDMQFVCNHFTWHSRTAFEDSELVENRRHLLRLWLACSDGPSLPSWMTNSYEGVTEDGRPNGIQVPGVPLIAPLEAE